MHELRTKYSRRLDGDSGVRSEWRGPVVFAFFLIVALCIGLATLLSRLAVNILMKRVKRLRADRFQKRKGLVTLLCGAALFTLYGASRVAERAENAALPAALTDTDTETPVIVLDAGHGEST